MQNKKPLNANKQPHGKWIVYYSTGKIWSKTNYINGERYGLDEWYNTMGELNQREYYAR
jgi:antitoxin component YwqK of YwqJK toxin-antitoxin module